MGKTRLFAVAACAAAVVGVGASAALAGEVKGPPGVPCGATGQPVCVAGGSTNTTAGPEHANSFCVFSGLNDMDGSDPLGQTSKITQTPADAPPGIPGHGIPGTPFANGCRGGSNLERGTT